MTVSLKLFSNHKYKLYCLDGLSMGPIILFDFQASHLKTLVVECRGLWKEMGDRGRKEREKRKPKHS